MDLVPLEAVMEARAVCPDAARAQAVLADALTGARAPRRTRAAERWTLTVRVARLPGAAGAKSAEARIVDDAGAVVSQRTVADRDARSCVPLARALGAWATLVIDAELERAEDAGVDTQRETVGPQPASAAVESDSEGPSLRPEPDRGAVVVHPATLEAGGGVYMRSGFGSGGVAGLSPFLAVEILPGWFLRPSLEVGRATAIVPLDAHRGAMLTHVGARVDFCRRIPGNYIDRHGMELDLCGGADAGILASDELVAMDGSALAPADRGRITSARATLGPSAVLRGELGAGFAIELHGAAGVNLLRGPLLAATTGADAMGEVGLGVSARLR